MKFVVIILIRTQTYIMFLGPLQCSYTNKHPCLLCVMCVCVCVLVRERERRGEILKSLVQCEGGYGQGYKTRKYM